MTSVLRGPKQTNGHFVVISSLGNPTGGGATPDAGFVFTYSGQSGSGGAATVGNFTPATWALGNHVSTIPVQVGNLLKDMGNTVVSANRTFRKIAPVVGSYNGYVFGTTSTIGFGVSTAADGTALVGYIEMGYEGFGRAAPVARFNNL